MSAINRLRLVAFVAVVGVPAALIVAFPDAAMVLGLSDWAVPVAIGWLIAALCTLGAVETVAARRDAEAYRRAHPKSFRCTCHAARASRGSEADR